MGSHFSECGCRREELVIYVSHYGGDIVEGDVWLIAREEI